MRYRISKPFWQPLMSCSSQLRSAAERERDLFSARENKKKKALGFTGSTGYQVGFRMSHV